MLKKISKLKNFKMENLPKCGQGLKLYIIYLTVVSV